MTRFTISDDRLRAIGATDFDDYTDLANAVREVAMALYERSIGVDYAKHPMVTPGSGQTFSKRMAGRPLAARVPFQCSACHSDIVNFVSKSGKVYHCNVEVGLYKNTRQALSAPNWFHDCPNRRPNR